MYKEINPYQCVKKGNLDNEIQKLYEIYANSSYNDVDGLVLNIREVQAELMNVEKEIREKNIVCKRHT